MSHPFSESEAQKEISEVNVVPLADVSLVLLIILLVLSPMMTQSMMHVKTAGKAVESATPPPLEETPPQQEVVLAVSLNPDGLAVGDKVFHDPGDFVAFMKAELVRRTDKKVFLTPHPDVAHGVVVHTLELIKSCGAQSVALVQVEEEAPSVEVRPAQTAP
jgi:biopolymer transport protein ExbD